MNTTTFVQELLRKLVEPLRREDEVAPTLEPTPDWISFEPAWLDHYLMHRDERATR